MSITVRPIQESDSTRWKELFAAYRAFYNLAEDPAAVDTTWNWMLHGEHSLFGLVAVNEEDQPVGLTNLRWFARPSAGTIGLYLDDLFTSDETRGTGVGGALLERVAEFAAENDATVVRWITAPNNEAARRLYDKYAIATPWVTYEMPPR